MTPQGYAVRYRGRRPLRMVIEEVAQQRAARKAYLEQQGMADLMRVESLKERLAEALPHMPDEVKAALSLQLEVLSSRPSQPEFPDDLPDSESAIRHRAIEDEAYARPGQYIEREPDGSFTCWDFDLILGGAESIAHNSKGEFTISSNSAPEGPGWVFTDSLAIAFHRYLYFMGVFAVEEAKRPCPECGNQPPKSCETCGGIGWVIPGPAVEAEFVEQTSQTSDRPPFKTWTDADEWEMLKLRNNLDDAGLELFLGRSRPLTSDGGAQ